MPKTEIPEAALIEIVEKCDENPAYGVIVPNEVRINGTPLLVPDGESVVVHEVKIPSVDCVMVTLTLFAKRVVIGAEVNA